MESPAYGDMPFFIKATPSCTDSNDTRGDDNSTRLLSESPTKIQHTIRNIMPIIILQLIWCRLTN